MAPKHEDDFVLTVFDDDVSDEGSIGGDDEDEFATRPISGTKRKRDEKKTTASSVKKQKKESSLLSGGQRDRDAPNRQDDEMLSDFEFEDADRTTALGDFDGWRLDGDRSKEDLDGPVDIDVLVARRLSKKAQAKKPSVVENDGGVDEELEEEVEVDEEEVDDSARVEQRASDSDEVFEDAMEQVDADTIGLEEEQDDEDDDVDGGDGNDGDEGSEGDNDDDDNDEGIVADPMPEPDRESASGSDAEEDVEEAAKRKAFFADEPAPSDTTGSGSFMTMNLSRPIIKGVYSVGFSTPTPIQAKTIPVALEGKDVVGGAVTGSGKTGAFMIPILERLLYRSKRVPTTRVVVLMPTRELALQCLTVAKKLAAFTDITFGRAIGGLNSREQEKELKLRPDIVIATPGRFIDFMRNSTALEVDKIEILVLDEADRMLEDGFADELNEILSTIPKSRQTMLFSATMTSRIDDLVRAGLQRPVRLMVDAQKAAASGLVQEFVRLRPHREGKRLGYLLYLCANIHTDRVIVFFRQKKEAHRVRVIFALCGLKAAELHGSMTQEQRITAIESFRSGRASFLLATDLASRGLDIKGINTVINYEAPQTHEIYLHRVGRTARAGRKGVSCTLAAEPDRKVVKAAVRAGKSLGASIRQRTVDPDDADEWQKKCDDFADEVEDILREEKEERAMQQTERTIQRAENVIKYEDEIKSRPKKTWFASEKDKLAAKKRGAELLNGPDAGAAEAGAKKREGGKLSNKKKKRLQDRDDRREGREWKKGKDVRGIGGKEMKDRLGSKKKAKPAGKPAGKKGPKRSK